MRTFIPNVATYKYTVQAIVQLAIPGLLGGPANALITARGAAVRRGLVRYLR
jgi:hypothetical protein